MVPTDSAMRVALESDQLEIETFAGECLQSASYDFGHRW